VNRNFDVVDEKKGREKVCVCVCVCENTSKERNWELLTAD